MLGDVRNPVKLSAQLQNDGTAVFELKVDPEQYAIDCGETWRTNPLNEGQQKDFATLAKWIFDDIKKLFPNQIIDLDILPMDCRKLMKYVIPYPSRKTKFYYLNESPHPIELSTSDMFAVDEHGKRIKGHVYVLMGSSDKYDVDTKQSKSLKKISRKKFDSLMKQLGYGFRTNLL